jgi:hypothetical protein
MTSFSRVLIMLGLCIGLFTEARCEEKPLRTIPVPQQEHGYRNFENTLLSTKAEFDKFLKASMKTGWNDRNAFEEALADAAIDFNKEILVLVRHGPVSGTSEVVFEAPVFKGRKVIVTINDKANGQTDDEANHCCALAVKKGVQAVVVRASWKEPIELQLLERGK